MQNTARPDDLANWFPDIIAQRVCRGWSCRHAKAKCTETPTHLYTILYIYAPANDLWWCVCVYVQQMYRAADLVLYHIIYIDRGGYKCYYIMH